MTYISTRLEWARDWATLAERDQRYATDKKLKPIEAQRLSELLKVLMNMKENENE